MKAIEIIKKQQMEWAKKNKIDVTEDGYTISLGDNLFESLSKAARDEFNAGHGKELEGDKAKMKALYSSSALACNFFHYWRFKDVTFIANALGIDGSYKDLQFEHTHSKPPEIGGIPPHLDAEISNLGSAKPIAIESKFTEPYGAGTKKLKDIYSQESHVWDPLTECGELAKRLVAGKEKFEYLDAPQLLKHILGILTDYGAGNFILIYLWYKVDGGEAQEHEQELARFKELVTPKAELQAMTYQELFARVKAKAGTKHRDYISYMEARYFL